MGFVLVQGGGNGSGTGNGNGSGQCISILEGCTVDELATFVIIILMQIQLMIHVKTLIQMQIVMVIV